MGFTGGTTDYGYIGVMISYLERILNIIADFFKKISGGMSSAPATTTEAPAPTTTAVAETTVIAG